MQLIDSRIFHPSTRFLCINKQTRIWTKIELLNRLNSAETFRQNEQTNEDEFEESRTSLVASVLRTVSLGK